MQNWAILVIYGRNLDPKEISKSLDIAPDKVLHNEENGITRWQLNSKLEGENPLNDHIDFILKKIYPARKQMIALSKRYKVSLICSFDKAQGNSVQIISRFLLILGYMGIDLEIYF